MNYTVYQRSSDNKWVGMAYYRDDSGKRKSIVSYGKSEREATKKIRMKIFDFENGYLHKSSRDFLVDFLKDYVQKNSGTKGKRWAITTSELYNSYIDKHIAPYFKNHKIDKLKPIDIDDFYEYKLDSGLSGNTVIKLHKFLNAAFNYGVKKDLLTSNPCSKATPPSTTEYKPNIYESDDFARLWQYVKDKYDRIPIALGAGCGLRRGEIFGLKWSDIDFIKGTLSICLTRTRLYSDVTKLPKNETSSRTISVPAYILDLLRDYKIERQIYNDDEFIMHVQPGYYSKRFKWLLESFNMPPTRLHDLRHYNATLMMLAGVPDRVSADRLGHKDLTMLHRIYQHTQQSVDKIASERIGELFAK